MQSKLKSHTIQYMSCTVISQWIFSTHMFTYMWDDIYEYLVVKSVGLNLFSLLGSSYSSSVDASSFVCVVILALYLTMNFVISSVINIYIYIYKEPIQPTAQYDLVRKPSTLDALIGYFTPSHVVHHRLLLQFLNVPENGSKKRPKHVEYYCSY